jgi:hypothetical protein
MPTQQFLSADGKSWLKDGDTLPDPLEFWTMYEADLSTLLSPVLTIP